jgi:hypothetical protein
VSSNDLARIHWQQGDVYNAILSLQNATGVAHEIDYREAFAFALGNMGLLYFEQGFFDQALICYSNSLPISRDLGAWSNALAVISNVGLLWVEQGDLASAEHCYRQALTIATKLGIASRIAALQHYSALLYYRQQEYAQAQRANDQAIDSAQAAQRADITFLAEVLAVKLRYRQTLAPISECLNALHRLREAYPNPDQQAALYFALWEINPADDEARRQAAEFYRQSYQQSGFYEDRQRYYTLTGELLPQRYQAPPLPGFLDPHPDRDLLALIASIPNLLD